MYMILCILLRRISPILSFFFFNDTATTEIYTLSLHDALPIFIFSIGSTRMLLAPVFWETMESLKKAGARDRKSTRLNSSHQIISYAVFCLKKKKIETLQSKHDKRTPALRV